MTNDCQWPGTDELMRTYHDQEWGVPVYDDGKIFEFLVLESMQAGLSWRTILHKRENFRQALAGFDYHQVAKFGDQELTRLMNDAGIVRNRLKLVAIINNAQKFIEVQKEFGSFAKYMWGFVNNKAIQSEITNAQQMPVVTKEAESFAKDLKARGFKFLGPTVVYAHMQALGMVNDHLVSCVRYKELQYQTSHA